MPLRQRVYQNGKELGTSISKVFSSHPVLRAREVSHERRQVGLVPMALEARSGLRFTARKGPAMSGVKWG